MASLALEMTDGLPEAAVQAAMDSIALPLSRHHFLFLQGLPGPFFRRLGEALRRQGAVVSRINFNGGDVLDWRGEGTHLYRGTADDWAAWLGDFVGARNVSDIVVFGDLRDAHCDARRVADRRGLRFHVFEEGYLRPNHVTLERGGVNGNSSFPRSVRALQLLDMQFPPQPDATLVASRFRDRAQQSAFYYTATQLAGLWFPHYRSHRHASAVREGLAWLRRFRNRRCEVEASIRDMARLAGRRFFLFPLQLEGDAQLRYHSPFGSMHDAVNHVLASFRSAPADVSLLIKQHPLDPDVDGWRGFITAAAAQAGVADRVAFVERWDLVPLLQVAHGVVTVNSTVGPLAMAAGVPVKTLGNAVYDIPGVTADVPLIDFWGAPPPVDAENFALLCRVLRAKTMINGGFHSDTALDLLIESATAKLIAG